ncbi:histidine kinase [Micromonospora sp. WMMA1363]|uniref:sensor histidine kinase n=1 Tax=Micromonospora sp. WMMA1363 TaxID=3053985 RepID=UPI00259D2B58|nr:sensor histidine kinase [Micromonospora sp. WMMA1363]MDM4718986.1 histidine kinase [Micromonospora sp. WMMA1363]
MISSPDAWSAVGGRPDRFLASPWPWRSLGYLASTVPLGIGALVVLTSLVSLGVLTTVIVAGFVILAGVPRLTGTIARLERQRLRLVFPAPAGGPSGRWPEIGHAALLATVLWVVDAVVLLLLSIPALLLLSPWLVRYERVEVTGWRIETRGEAYLAVAVGVLGLVAVAYVVTWVACGQAALVRVLLAAPDAHLTAAVADLRRSRRGLVDAFEVERRRIERDLHDGVQQRLVALTMTLGSAELEVSDGPGAVLLREAQRQAETALGELRATVRGIHPQVLSDHGLTAAVHEIADASPVPVAVDLQVARLSGPVETAAYFFVSEALTNIARHSGARSAAVHGWLHRDDLIVTVVDDGVGGADPARGTGLAGLAARLAAFDGTVTVASPAGGPTEVRMQCPINQPEA